MYVCFCADKTENEIRMLLNEGITDVETLMEKTDVGMGCGTCRLWIEKMIANLCEDNP